MIFLNPGKFFREAITSVQSQSFTNWELLLIDDGSTDESTFLAQELAMKNPGCIYYFSHPSCANCGMSASRNLGLQWARGRFIAFLDSDDVWHHNYLTTQFNVLAKAPEAVASFAGTCTWYSWTGHPTDLLRDKKRQSALFEDELVQPGSLIPVWLQQIEQTPATCSILIRTDIARKYQFEQSFQGMFEDQVFLYKVALNEIVFISNQILAYYRQHSNSTCHRAELSGTYNPNEPNQSELNFLLWFQSYLAERNIQTTAIQKALQSRLKEHKWRLSKPLWHIWKKLKQRTKRLRILHSIM